MCIENHHKWLYECNRTQEESLPLHRVLRLQRLGSGWPQQSGGQRCCVNGPADTQWISFTLSAGCPDTIPQVAAQEPTSSTDTVPAGPATGTRGDEEAPAQSTQEYLQ